MKEKVEHMLLFKNGNIAAFSNDEQIPAIQKGAIWLWADYAERKGYDVEGCVVTTPGGTSYKIQKREDGSWGCTGE